MKEELQSKASDAVKKLLTVGVGAIFLTEESLRNLVSEFKLPREMLGGLLESAQKTKKDFLENLTQDIMNRLKDRVDLMALLQEFLSQNEIDLRIKVRMKPKTSASKKSKKKTAET